jgi:hypothetical protein
MISEGAIKRLKVFALPDGTLLPHYRAGARQPMDEEWWQEVLHDPRAYTPVNETRFDEDSQYAHLRVDRQPYERGVFLPLRPGHGDRQGGPDQASGR